MLFYSTKNANLMIKENIAKNKYTISNKQTNKKVSNLKNLKNLTSRFKKWGKNVILMEDLQNSDRADPSKNSKSQKCHSSAQNVREKYNSDIGSSKLRSV